MKKIKLLLIMLLVALQLVACGQDKDDMTKKHSESREEVKKSNKSKSNEKNSKVEMSLEEQQEAMLVYLGQVVNYGDDSIRNVGYEGYYVNIYYNEYVLEGSYVRFSAPVSQYDERGIGFTNSEIQENGLTSVYICTGDTECQIKKGDYVTISGQITHRVGGYVYIEDTVVEEIGDDAKNRYEKQKNEAKSDRTLNYEKYSVDVMVDDFYSNAMRAKYKYFGKFLEIEGKVCEIDSSGKFFEICDFDDEYGIDPIRCIIASTVKDSNILELNAGDRIKVRGLCFEIDDTYGYKIATLGFKVKE